jgi:hypothetical protein
VATDGGRMFAQAVDIDLETVRHNARPSTRA